MYAYMDMEVTEGDGLCCPICGEETIVMRAKTIGNGKTKRLQIAELTNIDGYTTILYWLAENHITQYGAWLELAPRYAYALDEKGKIRAFSHRQSGGYAMDAPSLKWRPVKKFADKGCALVWSAFRVRWGDIIPESTDAWKSYLAAQYAAGTPVQIAYKLVTPTPIHATGAQPVPALAGCNTVLTDADSATVTGRADPAHAIAALQAQLATATQQLVETQAAVVDITAAIEQDCDAIGGGEDADAE